ncbi:MAG: tetratricopeptide repeat protein, partial [Pseudomonadota bacterium]
AAQIRAHVRAGDKESARALIAARSAETPDDPGLLHLRGAMHELDGELDQAARLYRRMIQVAPDLGAGYVRLAALQDRQEDQDAALATLTSGLDSVSDDAMLRLHVASIALRRGDAATAIAEFEQIYSDQPGSMLAANNLASALAEYREHDPQQIARAEKIARRLAGSTNPAFQDTFGWTRFLTGDTKGALSPLMRAAKELPKNPWVQYHVGMAHFEAGDLPTAKTHLEAALRIVGDRTFAPRSKITQAIETIGN